MRDLSQLGISAPYESAGQYGHIFDCCLGIFQSFFPKLSMRAALPSAWLWHLRHSSLFLEKHIFSRDNFLLCHGSRAHTMSVHISFIKPPFFGRLLDTPFKRYCHYYYSIQCYTFRNWLMNICYSAVGINTPVRVNSWLQTSVRPDPYDDIWTARYHRRWVWHRIVLVANGKSCPNFSFTEEVIHFYPCVQFGQIFGGCAFKDIIRYDCSCLWLLRGVSFCTRLSSEWTDSISIGFACRQVYAPEKS